jgi:hypothetical protein
MATEQDIPQPAAMSRSDDPLSKLYREFGILALAAALAATAYCTGQRKRGIEPRWE